MKLLFFTDPHIGVKRLANTTAESSKRLNLRILAELEKIRGIAIKEKVDHVICLGDVFDTFSNPETVIIQAANSLDTWVDYILEGNHDNVNVAGMQGSLSVLQEIFEGDIIRNNQGQNPIRIVDFNSLRLTFVTHHWDQSSFEASLELAKEKAIKAKNKHNILLLHCNYNRGFSNMSETSLNLTEGKAKELLEVFEYILMGHEHVPSSKLNGKLHIVGNVFPLGFDEVAGRRVLILDTSTMEFQSLTTITKNSLYGKCTLADLISCEESGEYFPILDLDLGGDKLPARLLNNILRSGSVLFFRGAVPSASKGKQTDVPVASCDGFTIDLKETVERAIQGNEKLNTLYVEIVNDTRA